MARLFPVSGSAAKAGVAVRARSLAGTAALALGSILLAPSTCSIAQISQGGGTSSQENRTSSGAANESSAPAVHESLKPQSKDAPGNGRGATAGKGHKTEGAGGFNNGLYGTGAGSNK